VRKSVFSFFILIAFSAPLFSQTYFPVSHRELEWKTFQSKFATVIYHYPLGDKARELAAIYDDIYTPICEFYNYFPDRQTLILKDTDDYSNGGAYFYDNKIEIWATALDFPLRGDHSWLKDVISHEFTHIVQIQSAMKWNRNYPAVYFQIFGYEDVRRPDVLYGFPNILISYPWMGLTVPAWLAEGTAQYNLPGLYFDYWDSHRDMILRSRTLDSTLLTFSEMVGFNKTSLDGETVYNQGFSLVSYLVRNYGLEATKKLNTSLRKISIFTINDAMNDAFGKSGVEIYNDWVAENKQTYQKQIAPILSEMNNGNEFQEEGFNNWVDDYNPEKNEVIVRSNTDKDYSGQITVLLKDSDGKLKREIKEIKPNSRIRFNSIKGKEYLLFSQHSAPTALLSIFSDLYVYDLKTKKTVRFTDGKRLFSPVYDGKKYIYAIQNRDAVKRIVRINISDIDFKTDDEFDLNVEDITPPNNYTDIEYYNLDYNNKRKAILLDASYAHGRHIFLFDLNDNSLTQISDDKYDSREPRWISDSSFVYSSDENGIFNIYRTDLNSGKKAQISQVQGGAFGAVKIDDNNFVSSSFSGRGYKIRKFAIKNYFLKPEKIYPYQNHPTSIEPKYSELNNLDFGKLDLESTPFIRENRQPFSFYPVLRLDSYSKQFGSYADNLSNGDLGNIGNNLWRDLKPGLYAFSTDPLDFIQFSASAFVAPGTQSKRMVDVDKDLFLDLNFAEPITANILPIRWGFDYYHLSRNTYNTVVIGFGADTAKTNAVYYLNQADLYSIFQLGVSSQIKLNFAYGFYTASTETFKHPVQPYFFSKSSDDYYLSTNYSVNYHLDMIERSKESEIAPVGREGSLTISKESSKLLYDYAIDEAARIIKPLYTNHEIFKISLGYKEHLKLPFHHQTLSFWLRRTSVITDSDESFFYNYLGGFLGMRGYSYYAIGGYELAHMQMNWIFPVWEDIDASLANIYFNRLYGSIYTDFGNAWNGKADLNNFKKDIGFELRLETTSFYLLPLRVFFSGTYGLDETVTKLQEGFQTTDGKKEVRFGKEWLFHFGILFNFDLGLEKL